MPHHTSTEQLLARNVRWDILLVLPSTAAPLPSAVQTLVEHEWTVSGGVPSRLIKDFSTKNAARLHPLPSSVPPLSGGQQRKSSIPSSQNLELSADLQAWIKDFYADGGEPGRGAVSMFNLLSFKPGKKESYLRYGKEFAQSIGSKRGGDAKLVGTVTSVQGKESTDGWDELALAHYPSLLHFADMLASEDYQSVNKEYRVPALKDTLILFTSELAVEEAVAGKGGASKL